MELQEDVAAKVQTIKQMIKNETELLPQGIDKIIFITNRKILDNGLLSFPYHLNCPADVNPLH